MRRKQFTAAQQEPIARELLYGRLSEDEALLKYELRPKKALRQRGPPTGPARSYSLRPSQSPDASPPMPVPHWRRSCGRRRDKSKFYTLID
ncbi:MAG: hypothetical protein ACRYG7_20570 [Janthinobacterium lividum]